MEKSQQPITEQRKMEDNPIPDVQNQLGEFRLWQLTSDVVYEKSLALIFTKDGPSSSRTLTLDGIMEALTHGHNNTVGVCGPKESTADALEKVSRRAKRDGLFDVVVTASVTCKPDSRRVQDEIGEALGLKFNVKDVPKRSIWPPALAVALGFRYDNEWYVAKRAKTLRERILMEKKILVVLRDLCKGLDLDKIGIPYGADHVGCKLLLTSASEEVLSKEMHAQEIFKV